jgi:peroxiredoxin
MIQVGDIAPDFELKGHDDKAHKLSDYRGKKVILAFYPLDFSPVCTNEHACFVNDLPRFNGANAVVLGVSVDSVWAHKAFAKHMGIDYPLLADFHPKGAMSDKYGLYYADKGITHRATVVIDEDGKVASVFHYDIPQQRNNDEILSAL